ncbi:MAG: ribonuclease H [Desulfococcaceae bacterium]|jgi:ribonuclease HI|nr:ribonuclease H [Desulfococcaceae bacterium]
MNDQIIEKDGRTWTRMRFKKNKVWVACNAQGKPLVENGKSLIRYQLDQDYEYMVFTRNIRSPDAKMPGTLKSQNRENLHPSRKKTSKSPKKNPEKDTCPEECDDENAICIYTDGASSGNPGPSGIGILMRYQGHEKEISEYLGMGTNNIAELEAIRVALSKVKKKNLPVRLYTDSAYAYGLLVKNWKAKKNEELVAAIREMLPEFSDLKFCKVKGHAGHPGNEKADQLATSAIRSGR